MERFSANAIVVMGVSGSGKSTVGKALAHKLGWKFQDGDDLHPEQNVLKLSKGQSLTDEDREPWLKILHKVLREWTEHHVDGVLVCSALRRCYRTALVGPDLSDSVVFVYLTGSRDLIAERMRSRSGHFMPVSLLDSQLRTLEPPDSTERVITCDVAGSVEEIVEMIVKRVAPRRNMHTV
ncbi:hypothetical protein EMCRGX_G021390 [Ephydatia muelleri]